MTTRLELRTSVRRRLEDTGANPLWDDVSLNEFLGDSIRRYGVRFPTERSVAVAGGSPTTTLPVVPAIDSLQIVRVADPKGRVIPRQMREKSDAGQGGLPTAQAWRWWNQTLLLTQPAMLGSWQIDYLGGRSTPTDDVSAVDIVPGDEEIVVLMTAGTALRRRAIENGKRGDARAAADMEHSADVFDGLARTMISARTRRVRAGWFE